VKIKFEFPHIIIYSARWCDLTGWFSGAKPMGFAIPPNIIVFRGPTHPMMPQWLVHEKIHVYQFLESFGLSHLISTCEYYYARFVLKMTPNEAYFYRCEEQEAWANQHNPEYLKQRKFWAFAKYIRYKPIVGRDASYLPVFRLQT
jgi:hypothetical protein